MEKMMHIAAQYLAAAGISFLEKQPDDSHTNVGFSVEDRTLFTRPLLSSGLTLQLSYDRFSLEWVTDGQQRSHMALDGKSHQQVLTWLRGSSEAHGLDKPYRYGFHYELPYSVTDDFVFRMDPTELKQLAAMRTTAHQAVHRLIEQQGIDSEVRIWPHHFDTGAYGALPETGVSIGLGLAIPDSVSETHYYYLSGYDSDGIITPEGFATLPYGRWHTSDYKGAVLSAEAINGENIHQFFTAAVNAFK